MKFKRLITLMLTVIFCISSFSLAFAAEDVVQPVSDEELLENYALVYDLGVGDFSDIATRGEFSLAIAKLLCYDYEINADRTVYPFPDVIPEMTEYNAVKFLNSLGIARGDEQGLFRSDKNITMGEALNLVIRSLGFEKYAQETSVLALASKKGLLKDLTYRSDEPLNHVSAIKLLYNMLMAPLKLSELNFGSDHKYFYNYIGLTEITGTVTDDGIITYEGKSELDAGNIVVDNVEYENLTKHEDLLARTITAYYKETSKNKKAIVSLTVDGESYVSIDARQISSYDSFVYKCYTDNNSLKSYRLDKNFVLIYNGRPVKFDASLTTEKFNALMTPKTGSVTLFKTNSGSYNVVRVLNYTNIVAGNTVYNDEYKIFDKYPVTNGSVVKNDSISINLKDSDNDVTVHDVYGNTIAPGMVKSNDVISYGASYDGTHIEMIVSNNIVTTAIDYVGDDCIGVGEDEYEFSSEYLEMLDNSMVVSPKAGKNYKIYINYRNEVVYAEATGSDDVLAVFGDYDVSSGISQKLKIRMYTQYGNLMIFNVDDKLIIDGKKYTKTDDIISKFASLGLVFDTVNADYSLVSISYEEEKGENIILSIDTPYFLNDYDSAYEDADSLHFIKNIKNQPGKKYMYMNNSFSGYCSVSASTVAFCVTDDAKSIEDVRVTDVNAESFTYSITGYTVSAYARGEHNMCADAILMAGFSVNRDFRNYEYGGNVKTGVVTKITNAVNEDGEEVNSLWIDDGHNVTKYTTETKDAINYSLWVGKGGKVEVGDIVRFLVKDGTIICNGAIFSMYDYSADTVITSSNYNSSASYSANSKYALLAGYINRISNGFLEISEDKIEDEIDYLSQDTFVIPFEAVPIIIYDKEKDTTRIGYQTDLISEQDDPSADERIFYVIHEMKPVFILLYK